MKAKIIKLKNGGVLIYEKTNLNNCSAVEVGFSVGAFNEKKPGTAHMLEHTLFKKTKKRSNSDVERDRNKITFLNASTSMDYIILKFFRTNKLFDESLEFSYDVLMNSILDDEYHETEKGVITEELNMCKGNEERDVCVKNFKQATSISKFASDIVGGNQSNISAIKFKDLQNFKNKHFVGNNFIVSVVSSLPLFKVKKKINNLFVKNIPYDGSYQKMPSYYDLNVIDKPSSLKIFKNEQEKISFMISIRIDVDEIGIFAKDYNYNFVAKYLSGSQGGLFLRLRNKGLVYRFETNISSFKDKSLFNIAFETSKEKIKEILELVAEEIKFVTTNLIDEKYIESYKKNLEYFADEKMPLRVPVKCSYNLMDYLSFGKVFKLSKRQKKALRAGVSPQRVQETAKKIFNKENPIYVTALGNITKKYIPDISYFTEKFLVEGNSNG